MKPNTRPSLRDGRTAYAVLSREPNFPLASLAPPIDDAVRPVGLAHISAKGLTVATTVRTTRFCRTQHIRLRQEASPDFGAVRLHAAADSQGLPALPAPLVPTLPRPPQARLAIKTTSRSPLLMSRDGRDIRRNRISVKWNIFGEVD